MKTVNKLAAQVKVGDALVNQDGSLLEVITKEVGNGMITFTCQAMGVRSKLNCLASTLVCVDSGVAY